MCKPDREGTGKIIDSTQSDLFLLDTAWCCGYTHVACSAKNKTPQFTKGRSMQELVTSHNDVLSAKSDQTEFLLTDDHLDWDWGNCCIKEWVQSWPKAVS